MVVSFCVALCIWMSLADSSAGSYSFRSCDKPKKLLCQNVFVANECGVMESCIEIWNTHNWSRFAMDLSVPCISCLAMNSTQYRLLVKETCKMLSSDADENECNALVEKLQFGNRLAKDGGVILCNILSVCKSHTYVGDLNFGVSQCIDCYNAVKMLDNTVTSPKRVGVVADKLRTVLCEGVPEGYHETCIDNINAHIPAIVAMAEKPMRADSVCTFLNVCPQVEESGNFDPSQLRRRNCSHTTKTYSWISRPSARTSYKWTSYTGLHSQSPSCEDCVAVVDAVKTELNNSALQQKIKEVIEDTYCRNMRFLEELCDNAVSTHFDKAIDKIVHSPSRPFCAAFGMCNSPGTSQDQDNLIATDNQPYSGRMMSQLALTNAIPVPGVCHVCQIVFEKLVELVIDEVTEERITAALDKVCKLVPSVYESQCDELVKQYAAQIVEAIIKGTAPKLACASLGLCPLEDRPLADFDAAGNSLEVTRFMGSVIQVLASTKSWDIECAICKTLVSIAYPLLNDTAKMEEVKNQLKMLCSFLPSSYVDTCTKFFDDDFTFLLVYIKEHVPEDKVCSLIGVCPADTSTLCSVNTDFACSSLPSAIKCSAVQRCIALGKAGNLVVVDKSICDQLSLSDTCASVELTHSCGKVEQCQLFRLAALLDSPSPDGDTVSLQDRSDNCGPCINMIDTMSLRRQLYGVSYYDKGNCHPTTKTYKTCAAIMAKQKEVMNNIISGRFTSLQICKRHSLCETPDAVQTNNERTGDLGRGKSTPVSSCADGFKYWCSSMEAALACNAVNYCKTFGYFGSSSGSSNPTESDSQGGNTDQLGLDPCDYGPTYWCQSRGNAEKCGPSAVRHCETLVWSPPVRSSSQHLLGRKPCTWGPSFWCASKQNAEMCNKVAYCQSINRLGGAAN